MSIDLAPEEPYVHPNLMGMRVEQLVAHLSGMRATMEDEPMIAAAYVLGTQRLLELLPLLLVEHRRLGNLVDRDPALCTATFLRCDSRIDGHHEEHYDYANRTRWSRGSRGITMTYESW